MATRAKLVDSSGSPADRVSVKSWWHAVPATIFFELQNRECVGMNWSPLKQCSIPCSLIGMMLVMLVPQPASGQRILEIPAKPTCRDCRIELLPVNSIGRLSDPVSLRHDLAVAVDSEGSFFIANTFNRGEIAVYGPDGAYMGSFGRSGQGPGEFSGHIMALRVDSADRIFVFEHHRYTVLGPGAAELEAVARLPRHLQDVLVLPGRRLLLHHANADMSRAVPLFYLLDESGEEVRPFGEVSVDAGAPFSDVVRHLSPDSDTTFWASHVGRPEVELWSTDGKELCSVRSEETPSGLRSDSVWRDEEGYLWMLMRIPDPDWMPPPEKLPDPIPPSSPYSLDRLAGSDMWDSVLRVVDLTDGVVVAEGRFGDLLVHVPGRRPLVYTTREDDETGLVVLHAWTPHLTSGAL